MNVEKSLWQASSKETINTDPLDENITTDLVIIGGGYTGCSAALHAAKSGMDVQLLEADTIGFGGSGRNVGLVNAGLWLPPLEVENILGEKSGAKLNTLLAKAPDLVFSLIERYEIQCDPVRSGTLHCAHSRKGFVDLQSRYEQLTARGAPVRLLEKERAALRTGSTSFAGALFDPRAGTINPRAYNQGLARAALQAGARISESTLAKSIHYKDKNWIVDTAKGQVRAAKLLIATNAYHRAIIGVDSQQYTPVHFFQFATRPLSEHFRELILPSGEGCWDTAKIMSSFRLDVDGRLLVGAIGALDHLASSIHAKWAKRKLQSLFPFLAETIFEYNWHGRIAMTHDHIPKILNFGNNGHAIFGFSGRGIGPGTMFGKAFVDFLVNDDSACLPINRIDQHTEFYPEVKKRVFELGASAAHLVADR